MQVMNLRIVFVCVRARVLCEFTVLLCIGYRLNLSGLILMFTAFSIGDEYVAAAVSSWISLKVVCVWNRA